MAKNRIILLCLFFLLVIPTISAQNISIDYPDEVEIGKEFQIKLQLIDFESGTYDVKIDMFGDGARIARILNNGVWKSTVYYISEAIESGQEEDFTMKIESYVGNINFEVKIRESGSETKYSIFGGYSLISKDSDTLQEWQEPENQIDETQEEPESVNDKNTNGERSVQLTGSAINDEDKSNIIYLNPKDIKTDENFKSEAKGKNTIWAFALFCIALILLFILKKVNDVRKNGIK